jgi:hypothetical protein
MAALFSSVLGSYYNQTGPTPAELRDAFLRQRGSAVEQVVHRAIERGEVDPARLTPRIINLPLRSVPQRNVDDTQVRPRPRPAPDRRRHLHPSGHHATTSPLTPMSEESVIQEF